MDEESPICVKYDCVIDADEVVRIKYHRCRSSWSSLDQTSGLRGCTLKIDAPVLT